MAGRYKNRTCRAVMVLAALGVGAAFFFILNICIGSVRITLPELTGQEGGETVRKILWDIRLPRAAAVLILGGPFPLRDTCCRLFLTIPLQGLLCWGFPPGQKWQWRL